MTLVLCLLAASDRTGVKIPADGRKRKWDWLRVSEHHGLDPLSGA